MENIEIKNKNIFLNLNDDEEIVYIPEQRREDLFFVILFIIFAVPLFLWFILMFFVAMEKGSWVAPIMAIVALYFPYFSYIYIRDYFFSELVLTNQRLIISRFGKLIFINNNQIKLINEWSNGIARTYIKTDTKKIYLVTNIRGTKLEHKFKEIYPNSNIKTLKFTAGSKRDWALCIMFLVAMFYIIIRFHPGY